MSDGSKLDFGPWIKESGGDDALVELLRANGFNSKLSLGNLSMDSEDAAPFMQQLNYGQKCLLRGLIKLCREEDGSSYGSAASKAAGLTNKSASIREKIGRLFRCEGSKPGPAPKEVQPTKEFQPASTYKRKGSCGKGKGPAKKKVKQMKLKVHDGVGLAVVALQLAFNTASHGNN